MNPDLVRYYNSMPTSPQGRQRHGSCARTQLLSPARARPPRTRRRRRRPRVVASGTFDLQHLGLVVLREALDLLLEAKRSARLDEKGRNESHGFGADLADLKCSFAGVDLSADLPNPCGFRVPAPQLIHPRPNPPMHFRPQRPPPSRPT